MAGRLSTGRGRRPHRPLDRRLARAPILAARPRQRVLHALHHGGDVRGKRGGLRHARGRDDAGQLHNPADHNHDVRREHLDRRDRDLLDELERLVREKKALLDREGND